MAKGKISSLMQKTGGTGLSHCSSLGHLPQRPCIRRDIRFKKSQEFADVNVVDATEEGDDDCGEASDDFKTEHQYDEDNSDPTCYAFFQMTIHAKPSRRSRKDNTDPTWNLYTQGLVAGSTSQYINTPTAWHSASSVSEFQPTSG
ncbi:hypothetical protein ABW21_db0207081 [Orbilia brochopaga]|nr:hypothetical protein ABW21_db0207081 [Drechslerella brochopaga]